ncbi:MAG: VaFE repeat-containing surface-anchored protein [Eggerthellaceae bacterium]|nr:VaFE repeat-containing surface-anchored protein [Eggerthellaceae bacterium]
MEAKQPNRIAQAVRAFFAALLVAGLLPLAAPSCAPQAYADEIPAVGSTVSGTCFIGDARLVPPNSYFDVEFGDENFSGTWELHCLDYSAAEPKYVHADYEATVTDVNIAEQTVTYDMYITPPGVTDGVSRNELGLIGYQHVGGPMTVKRNFGGYLEVNKASAVADITDGNACYTLAGAAYNVYDLDGNLRCTLTTDETGRACSELLPTGDYRVQEASAPDGYLLDETSYEAHVSTGETTLVTTQESPLVERQNLAVAKIDADTALAQPQGDAALANAEFTYRYYDGYYETAEEAEASGAAARTWVMRTNEAGETSIFRADEGFLVSGDELYRDQSGNIVVPLGTLVIQETKAPDGYLLASGAPVVVQLRQSGAEVVRTKSLPDRATSSGEKAVGVKESVVRGGATVEKRDAATRSLDPLGGASLDPTTFAVANAGTRAVVVGGITYEPGAVVLTIATENGVASTAADALPYGTYEIRETATGAGYELIDTQPRTFSIRENGQMVVFDAENAFFNSVMRGDVEFVKARETDQARLAGVPFKITSLTTGESHVVVTDENGYATTAADFNAHTYRTNANDAVAAGDAAAAADASLVDNRAGVWFSGRNDASAETPAPVDDGLGALPYDTYRIEELACPANEGLTLITLDAVTVSRNNRTVSLGTFDNQPGPEISTAARDALDNDSQVVADTHASIVDRVAYTGATRGSTYRLEATLYDKTSDRFVSDEQGRVLSFERTFVAASSSGTTEIECGSVDLLPHAGSDIVVFERLYDMTTGGNLVAEHADADDYAQTVHVLVPEIGTTAMRAHDGADVVAVDPAASLVDVVAYANLVPGAAYEAEATLMAKDAEGNATALLDSEGNPYRACTPFAPEQAQGSVEVALGGVSTLDLAGTRLVVFERVYRLSDDGNRTLVAEHVDADCAAQTLAVEQPSLATSVSDAADGDRAVVGDAESRIVDTVEFSGLNPQRPYRVEGVIVDAHAYIEALDTTQDHAAAVEAAAVRDGEGNVVGASTSFTPEEASGSVDVTFAFDSRPYTGSSLVVLETLYADKAVVGAHHDPTDALQTFDVATTSIGTVALDALSATHTATADEGTAVVDTVTVENAVSGREYTMFGILVDKQTGLPVTGGEDKVDEDALASFARDLFAALGGTVESAEGRLTVQCEGAFGAYSEPDVTRVLERYADVVQHLAFAQTAFTAAEPTFTVEVHLPINAEDLPDTATVAYEFLVSDGRVVAAHTDIESPDQSVDILRSRLSTFAHDAADDDHFLDPAPGARIVDTVSYTHLIPGKEYRLHGALMSLDKKEPLVVNGKAVEAELTFTPSEESGTVELVFDFDATGLDGSTLVVFDELFKDDVLVADHAEWDNSAQSVCVTVGEHGSFAQTSGNLPRTGDGLPLVAAAATLVAGTAALAALAFRSKLRKRL